MSRRSRSGRRVQGAKRVPRGRMSADISDTWAAENPSKPGRLSPGGLLGAVRFDDYATDPDRHFDEMFSSRGNVRPLYRALAQRMTALTPAEFEGRKKTVDLLLR